MLFKNLKNTMFIVSMVLLGATSVHAVEQVNGVYQIGSCKDLVDFATMIDSQNQSLNAVLTKSFDMNDEYSSGTTCNEKGFYGIGVSVTSSGNKNNATVSVSRTMYTGHFDGQGYTISNVVIDDGGTKIQDMGLFNEIGGSAIVENIILENISIISRANGTISQNAGPISVGSIVGWMPAGTVKNCFVSGSISTTGTNIAVGGIVGYLDGGSILDCLSAVDIVASNDDNNIGGIAGYAVHYKSNALIERCVYDGSTLNNLGNGAVGGLVGNTTGIYSGCTKPVLEGNYYNTSAATDGVGTDASAAGVVKTSNMNSPEVACALNQGSWNEGTSTCSDAQSDIWGTGDRLTNAGVSRDEDGEITYAITFDANGGNFSVGAKTEKILKLKDAITSDEIGVPTREGYTFLGWSLNSRATDKDDNLGVVVKSTIVYAIWHEQETVTFIANTNGLEGALFSDGLALKSKNMDYGVAISTENVGTPVDFTVGDGESKVYYAFMGWSLSENATEPDADLGIVNGDVSVYAVWSVTQSVFYTVTFNTNNHGTAPLAQRIEKNHLATRPTAPSANGFTFVGWYSNSYGTGSAFDFEKDAVTVDMTLYAKWNAVTYNVVYHNLENATNSVSNPSSYTALDESIVLQKPTKEGFTFKGWFYDESLTNPATGIVSGSTGDKNFYASWVKTTYTVSFAAGSNGMGTIDKKIKDYGVDLELPTSGFTPRTENTRLGGWNYTDGGSVCDIPIAEEGSLLYTRDADATLYPCWVGLTSYAITYSLHFVDSKGAKVKEDVVTVINQNETLTHIMVKPEDVPGFTFGVWSSASYIGENRKPVSIAVANGKFTMPSFNVSIEGTSVLNTYSITYHNLGSHTHDNAVKYTVLSDDVLLSAAKGDSAKHVFAGWYNNERLTGDAVTSIPQGSTGNVNLYAKWRRVNYGSVTISADGHTVTVNSDSKESVELTEEGVEVENIVFERNGLEPGLFATVVLPFDLPEGTTLNAKYYYFYEMEDLGTQWFARFKNIGSGVLPSADVPYVFILNSGEYSLKFDLPANKKAVVHSGTIQNKTSLSGDWTFNGMYDYKEWLAGDPELGLAYGFAAKNEADVSKGKFGKAGVGNFIYPTRAYLKKKNASVEHAAALAKPSPDGIVSRTSFRSLPAEIDAVFEDENDDVMAIGKFNTVTGQVKINRWIDLKGRSSLKKPSAKGVYFNEKTY